MAAMMCSTVETDTPVVATNDVRFLRADDFNAHEARVCIHDGRVLADNTDAAGFMNNLRQGFPDIVFKGARVMMLGAGGAARAACPRATSR